MLSPKCLQKISHTLKHSWADSTLTNYTQSVNRYLAFCDRERIPTPCRIPASEFLLCAFAAESAGIHAGTTARNHISAVRAWHIAQNAVWNGNIRLQYVLTGVENLAPNSSKRGPRPPITLEMLQLLYNHLDLRDPFDAAVFACATIAFWAQCRLGELLPTSSSITPQNSLPTRAHIHPAKNNTSARNLRLPRTKTHASGEDVTITPQNFPINPIAALNNHLHLNLLDASLPLFAFSTSCGPRNLNRARFLERCNSIWTAHGYPRSTGHSFRIGGTTHLLLAGVSPDVVKVMGRWSSDAFHRYWRSTDALAAIHATNVSIDSSHKRRRLI